MGLLVHGTVSHICKSYPWASYQIRKKCGLRMRWESHERFPHHGETASLGSRHASRHARAAIHVGVASPQWWKKCSRHPRRMRNPQFCVSSKKPMARWRCCWSLFRHHRTIIHHNNHTYSQTSNIVGAAPTGDAPTTSEWSTMAW